MTVPTFHAVIGPHSVIAGFAENWSGIARFVSLPYDFALVPLTERLCEDIVDLVGKTRVKPRADFTRLPAQVEEVMLLGLSVTGPIGYIEVAYSGGVGTQAAIGWKDRAVAFGPRHSESSWSDEGPKTEPPGERAVNQLLAWLGVRKHDDRDEFDLLVLGRFSETESAAEKYGVKRQWEGRRR